MFPIETEYAISVDDSVLESNREIPNAERTAWNGITNQIDEKIELRSRRQTDFEIGRSDEAAHAVFSFVPLGAFFQLDPAAGDSAGVCSDRWTFRLNGVRVSRCRISCGRLSGKKSRAC